MKGDNMKRFIALALAATFALPSFALLSGCNTVEGAGKDIQAGGGKIKEEARENKKYGQIREAPEPTASGVDDPAPDAVCA
jgi:entericidin B